MCIYYFISYRNSLCGFKCNFIRNRKYDTLCWFYCRWNNSIFDGFIVGPKIIGNKVGLNTFWVIVSMIIFGNLFGIVGMFLGTPIMSILKLFYVDLLKKAKQGGEQ